MFGKKRNVPAVLSVIVAALMISAANAGRFSSDAAAVETQHSFSASTWPSQANGPSLSASPCADALEQGFVCAAANRRALDIMSAGQFEAATVVQDVRTGALVAFAASKPSRLDVTTPVLPLSLSKLLLAASWWDNRQPASSFESTKGKANASNPAYRSRVSVHDMIVGGSDSAGRQMAVALRRSVGAQVVLEDLKRYGLGPRTSAQRDNDFWGDVSPAWRERLMPSPAYASLDVGMKDNEWGDTLSIGESNLTVTGLHISRFLQAVGNKGMMLPPVAREEQPMPSSERASHRQALKPIRIMRASTAMRLQSAMRDTVKRGSAQSIAAALKDTGWHIGGKTGTGPGPLPIGPQSDGWFAGLIFDPRGKARFTVATFVRHGGLGGGNAAKISAELARYIIGENTKMRRHTRPASSENKAVEKARPPFILKGDAPRTSWTSLRKKSSAPA